MPPACALGIVSGIIIYLSRLSHSAECSKRIFTKEVAAKNCIYALQRWRRASSPSQSKPDGFASSPKVGAFGSPRELHLFAKASPFGRGGCERSEQTERASPLKAKHPGWKQPGCFAYMIISARSRRFHRHPPQGCRRKQGCRRSGARRRGLPPPCGSRGAGRGRRTCRPDSFAPVP